MTDTEIRNRMIRQTAKTQVQNAIAQAAKSSTPPGHAVVTTPTGFTIIAGAYSWPPRTGKRTNLPKPEAISCSY